MWLRDSLIPRPSYLHLSFVVALSLVWLLSQPPRGVAAAPVLSIVPITWNVLGLDSNDVSSGPDTFPVGARLCNTGDAPATSIASSFVWDSTNALLNLTGPSTLAQSLLGVGACTDLYYNVVVSRSSSAYDTTRRYHITATASGIGTVSTSTPREL